MSDGATQVPSRRPALNMVHGLPDDQQVSASLDPAGNVHVTRLGTPSFLTQIQGERRFVDVWLGPGAPALGAFTPRPTINYIADADLCTKALQAAVTLSQSVSVPWFNHPRSVLANTRDRVSSILQGIPGLIVPKTARVAGATMTKLLATVEARHIGYPAIVRIVGRHGGKGLVLMNGPDDVGGFDSIPWGGQDLYVSEYVDCRSADGRYRKHRFIVIGGQPILRHIVIGTKWLLNFDDSLFIPATLDEEQIALHSLIDDLSPGLSDKIGLISERLALDYVGIDCCLREDGAMVLFEANPTMNILFNDYPPPNIWETPVARARAALLTLLDHPERWVFGSPSA